MKQGLPEIKNRPKAPKMKKPKREPKEKYVVFNIASKKVVNDIEDEIFSKLVHYDYVFGVSTLSVHDDLKSARKFRKENGGIILRAVE